MKLKRILRFYFSADSLNKAFDNLILNKACAPYADAQDTAEKLCAVIDDKIRLERLWAYLDGVLSGLTDGESQTLLKYSARSAAVKSGDREVKRVVIKFTRRARRLAEFEEDIAVLKNYYCLLREKDLRLNV